MNFSAALSTFLIALREGVEAALVVGIVLAFLKQAGQSQLKRWVYAGLGAGIAASVVLASLFQLFVPVLQNAFPQYAGIIEFLYEGVFCVLAIIMLSWMLIWMTKQAKFMKAQVEGTLSQALKNNHSSAWNIFTLIFVAVAREGFETVALITTNTGSGAYGAGLGALLGIVSAALIGVALFKLGVKINIRQFFQIMGILLVFIVAGLVVTALGKFDAAAASLASYSRASQDFCFYYERFTKIHSCILGPIVWNTSKILPDEQFPGIVLKALFGYHHHLYVVQALAYLTLLFSIGGVYISSITGGFVKKTVVQKS
jgi:high-affinity iron transporter